MDITRKQFLGGMFFGAVLMMFGRFFNLFRGSNGGKIARFWKKTEGLAG